MLHVAREPSLVAKHEAFTYQVEAVEAVKGLEYAAIFHEQGLGKTKIAIDLSLLWLKAGTVDSVLIVTKRSLIQNWRDELAIHTHIKPRLLDQDRTRNFHAFNSPVRLYLTHYEVLRSEQKRLALFLKTRRVGVLLDEAHKIKNPRSEVAKVLFSLAPGFCRRVILTGTPVANRPYDLWSQIYFLDHGQSLGADFDGFRRQLDLSNDLHSDRAKAEAFEAALSGVFDHIRPFSVRETKQSSHLQLPDKELRNVSVELESRQAEIYRQFRDELAAIVVKEGKPLLDDAEEMLKRLLRLVQVASNPFLVDETYRATPGKFPALEDLLHQAIDNGEKVIVWTAFTGNADWLNKRLDRFGALRVHGKLPQSVRSEALASFKQDKDCKVLIATPAAAKEGLTLTVANHAVFYDRSFSLDDYLQAQDRIHRISQGKTCYITNLIAEDTVDEWIDELLGAKHLAAQLGQGDISAEQYVAQASYSYGEMVRVVLGLEDGHVNAGR